MSEVFAVIEAGEVDALRALVRRDPGAASLRNDQGVSAVLWTAYRGRPDLTAVLLSAGPELDVFEAAVVGAAGRLARLVEAEPSLATAYAPDGFTALQLAAHFGHGDVVRVLVERGADLHAVSLNSLGVTALHAACASRETAVVRLLLAAGADVNAREHNGTTPLHQAAEHGDRELAGLLFEQGADRSAALDDGWTAADLAAEKGHADLAALLGG